MVSVEDFSQVFPMRVLQGFIWNELTLIMIFKKS
jgi:hypothetical protein